MIQLLLGGLVSCLCNVSVAENGPEPKDNGGSSLIQERYIAVDNVCAWPNLTLMPDGSVIATIYNRPNHLSEPGGNVECWGSIDGGRLWRKRGTAAEHEPESSRGNVAAGVAHNGDLIVLSAGLSYTPWTRLLPWVCRSGDGGRTWDVNKDSKNAVVFPTGQDHEKHNKKVLKPFGDIVMLDGNRLAACFYTDAGNVCVFFSEDDGRSWKAESTMTTDFRGETAILRTRSGRWLAAARTEASLTTKVAPEIGLKLFTSENEGLTWAAGQLLTTPAFELPGHLLQLQDGRVLLCYGQRTAQAIGFRLSDDNGQTWGEPQTLVSLPVVTSVRPVNGRDLGYPSTVQLADGTLLTAYYSIGVEHHRRYHMGVVRWAAP